MDCACGVVAHILAAILGRDNSQVCRVRTVVAMVAVMVAVQPVLPVAQVGEVWSALAPLLSEAARAVAPLFLRVLFLDYS